MRLVRAFLKERKRVHSAAEQARSAACACLATMKNLREIVERYSSLATRFGEPIALSAFALSPEETEALFSSFDEDYHISRFLHFSRANGSASFLISGEFVTHVAFDPAIRSVL